MIFFGAIAVIDLTPFFDINLKAKTVNVLNHSGTNKLLKFKKYKNFKYSYNSNRRNTIFQDHIGDDLINSKSKIFGLISNNKNNEKKIQSLEVESDKQYQIGNISYAEGNATIRLKNFILVADKISYNKDEKSFLAKGNVSFYKGKQYFEASKIVYNLEKREGYIKDVYGVIEVDKFNDDFDLGPVEDVKNLEDVSDLEFVDTTSFGLVNDFESGSKLNITDVKLQIPSVKKWRFSSDELIIKSDILSSNNIFFTNDAYNKPQFLLQSKNFSGEIVDSKLKLISRNSWIILDDKFKIPIGRRTIFDKDPLIKWGIGSDHDEKDGLFISRGFDKIKINENYQIRLKPYFLLQRAFEGETNSYRAKDSSILSDKIKTNTEFTDLFAIDTDIYGKVNDWNLSLSGSLNSLNFKRLSESSRAKLTFGKSVDLIEKLSKDSSLEKNILDFQIYSAYREKVERGFSGEDEIYNGYGITFAQKKYWNKNNVKRNLSYIYDLGKFKAKSSLINEFENLSRNVFSINYDYSFPIWEKNNLDQRINNTYKYSPVVINQGVNFNTSLKTGLFFYGDGSSQKIITISAGPKITLGSFTNNFLDFTKINLETIYVLKDGKSPFSFDDVNDKARLKIFAEQQIYRALVLSYENYLNLDNRFSNYGEFTKPKYGLDLKRRSYSLGAFYDASNDSLGLQFNIYNFDYSGNSSRF